MSVSAVDWPVGTKQKVNAVLVAAGVGTLSYYMYKYFGIARRTSERFKLVYFNGRGLAEMSRILLKATGTPFEDKRFRLDNYKYGSLNKPEYDVEYRNDDEKSGYKFEEAPFSQLPVLEIHYWYGSVKKIAQSAAIEMYLAAKLGLIGSTDVEAQQVHSVLLVLKEISADDYKADNDKTKEEEFLNKLETVYLPNLERFGQQNGTDEFHIKAMVGRTCTAADFAVWYLFNGFFLRKPRVHEWINEILHSSRNFFLLNGIVSRVDRLPAIEQYLSERPETPF